MVLVAIKCNFLRTRSVRSLRRKFSVPSSDFRTICYCEQAVELIDHTVIFLKTFHRLLLLCYYIVISFEGGLHLGHPDDLLLAKVGCQSDKSPDDAFFFFLKNSLIKRTVNESPQINNKGTSLTIERHMKLKRRSLIL